MTIFAGLDVSDKTTHVCLVDADGVVMKRDVVASDPDVLAKWLGKHCPGLARVVLETGPLSTFLYHGLTERGIPIGASMEVIEEQLRASNRLLECRAAEDPVCIRLMSVPGVGPITALTFTASIEDPHRRTRCPWQHIQGRRSDAPSIAL